MFVTVAEHGGEKDSYARKEADMGKPKLTEEMVERMVELKGHGLTNKDICLAMGITETTFYRWVGQPRNELQRALGESLKKAEAAYKEELLETIKAAALAKNSFWTAAAWILERKWPEDFGQNRATKDEAEAAPQIVLGVTVKKADDEGA